MLKPSSKLSLIAISIAAMSFGSTAIAENVNITVTIENLAPTNSVSFAPFRLAFNNGTFDSFNEGQTATAPIISIAEGGSGSEWFPAFAAADPTAVLGTILGPTAPPLQPGQTSSATFAVDSVINKYFTFASMVVPSNDYFIGNDDPQAHRLFDANGNLNLTSINLKASDIWESGSELFNPLNAAFLQIGMNALREADDDVVTRDFEELSGFDGLVTATGYTFKSALTANTDVFRITFGVSEVPVPAALPLMGSALAVFGLAKRRKSKIA
jgi:Spondin_N